MNVFDDGSLMLSYVALRLKSHHFSNIVKHKHNTTVGDSSHTRQGETVEALFRSGLVHFVSPRH